MGQIKNHASSKLREKRAPRAPRSSNTDGSVPPAYLEESNPCGS